MLESNSAIFVSVAPSAGAWIETSELGLLTKKMAVAPSAGAWIETLTKAMQYLL